VNWGIRGQPPARRAYAPEGAHSVMEEQWSGGGLEVGPVVVRWGGTMPRLKMRTRRRRKRKGLGRGTDSEW
jgi:hypothetical protein